MMSFENERNKLRGGYYTPAPIARFLAQWAVGQDSLHVLEPSAGNGEIVAAAAERLGYNATITAVELDGDEAKKVVARGGQCTTVVEGDFFSWFSGNNSDGMYDAVLGNPPFIRYQDFPEQQRQPALMLMRQEGLHPTKLTNAWVPFIVAATRALRPGGRLAFVVPAELLQVKYAEELRQYLVRKFSRLTIVTFRELLFSGIEQETVLLLATRQDSPTAEITFIELDGITDLRLDTVSQCPKVAVDLDHAKVKWTQYYLTSAELALIRELETADSLCTLGDLAEVDVGIVTGRNEFFVLSEPDARNLGVMPWCIPLVGRGAQIPGLVLRNNDWQNLANNSGKCYLLHLGDVSRNDLSEKVLAYTEYGEQREFHTGYKCRMRLPRWWNLPSVWVPDAFLLRQIYSGPRIVHNSAGVTCTDTIHRVRSKQGIDPAWLAASSMNSLTFAFAELLGRSYGGGVLELEPTEAERLPFPKPSTQNDLDLERLDSVARRDHVEHAVREIDELVLKPAGLDDSDIATLHGIWQKLSQRRIQRSKR